LKGAKLDETRDTEVMLTVDPKKLSSRTFNFQGEQDAISEWVDYFWRAILINKPDMVELKVEPMNQTKVLTFYIMK
jgi:vacuolar protein sorting-associated protein 13A/C